MSERWLHTRPGRSRLLFRGESVRFPPTGRIATGKGRRMVEGVVSTQRAVYRAKKWPMAGKPRGEFDVDKTPPDSPRESQSSSPRLPIAQAPGPLAPEPRAVFGDVRGKEGRRFCDPGAAVVINILFAVGRNRSPFLSRLSPCKSTR